jgi:RNA polymerase sigma factor (TIGR02999 family)
MTGLLEAASHGDPAAMSQLLPLVYDELRRVAARLMRRERPGQTIQATALVNEAYLRLLGGRAPAFQDRAHFMAIAARSMREILVDRARARNAAKRGGGAAAVELDESRMAGQPMSEDVLAVDEALTRLANIDARQARVVELRFFAGMSVEEIAEATGVSAGTVKRDWAVARAWLYRELAPRS